MAEILKANVKINDARSMRAVCFHVSPNLEIRKAFDDMFDEMFIAGDPLEDIVKKLAWKLLDGLQYGNWPEPKKVENS